MCACAACYCSYYLRAGLVEKIRYHHHFGVCKTLVVAAAAAVYQEPKIEVKARNSAFLFGQKIFAFPQKIQFLEFMGRSNSTHASLIPRPRGRREKWPGIHCLRMHEKPHDFMGYHIPSFTNR